MSEVEQEQKEARRLAATERDRVRFEEEALGLADQVYRVARRLVGSREEAEDLMQETYARAFRSWQQYQPGTNLRAWLLRILTNLNIDRGRRVQRTPDMQPLEEGDYFLYNRLEETGGGEPDEERVVERLSQDDIVDALSAVPHNFRDVVVLVDIGDFSYADAAQILDVPVGTVMSRLHRGRRILKRELADRSVGGGMIDPCARCEEVLQPFLDRELTEAERPEAESHLDDCSYCRKRYRFEVELRRYVRQAVDRADAGRAQGAARGAARAPRRSKGQGASRVEGSARDRRDHPRRAGRPRASGRRSSGLLVDEVVARARESRSLDELVVVAGAHDVDAAVPVVPCPSWAARPGGVASLRRSRPRAPVPMPRSCCSPTAPISLPPRSTASSPPGARAPGRVVAASYDGERSHPVLLDRSRLGRRARRGRAGARGRPRLLRRSRRAGGRRRSRRPAGAAQEAVDVRMSSSSRSSSSASTRRSRRRACAGSSTRERGGAAGRPAARAGRMARGGAGVPLPLERRGDAGGGRLRDLARRRAPRGGAARGPAGAAAGARVEPALAASR